MAELRDERLQLRVDRRAKRRLEEAAEASHLSLTAFVVQAASQQADQVLADQAVIHLSPEAAKNFLEVLDSPRDFNEVLYKAMHRPVRTEWLD